MINCEQDVCEKCTHLAVSDGGIFCILYRKELETNILGNAVRYSKCNDISKKHAVEFLKERKESKTMPHLMTMEEYIEFASSNKNDLKISDEKTALELINEKTGKIKAEVSGVVADE